MFDIEIPFLPRSGNKARALEENNVTPTKEDLLPSTYAEVKWGSISRLSSARRRPELSEIIYPAEKGNKKYLQKKAAATREATCERRGLSLHPAKCAE
ncbi:hypothetical protein MSLAZ_2099 [Methanosarcina lacustris Z-7289]|uniref:Uncharacterized protein n=1 Tax=Methanosarcina lacustris Z-7289 TaxID=1434111 RepID=A0A0E3WRN4_9EURY|nr:hypothetical protein [Methanosarcina lacustris]AKB75360.1 hypothetical protein MSLAZ_2099 [Methanosarcina lacustris Z-7289]